MKTVFCQYGVHCKPWWIAGCFDKFCGCWLLVIQIRADSTVPETVTKKVRRICSPCDDIIIYIIIVMVCLLSSWLQGITPSWTIQVVKCLFWIISLKTTTMVFHILGFWTCGERVLRRLCGEEFQLNLTLAHIQGRSENISIRMCVKPLRMLWKTENINCGYNFSCLLTLLELHEVLHEVLHADLCMKYLIR